MTNGGLVAATLPNRMVMKNDWKCVVRPKRVAVNHPVSGLFHTEFDGDAEGFYNDLECGKHFLTQTPTNPDDVTKRLNDRRVKATVKCR
jgi:hypothetical protein